MKVTTPDGKRDTLMYVNLTLLFPREDCRTLLGLLWDYLRAEGNHNTILHLKGKESKQWHLGILPRPSEPAFVFIFVWAVNYVMHLFTGLRWWGVSGIFFRTKPSWLTATPYQCRNPSVTVWDSTTNLSNPLSLLAGTHTDSAPGLSWQVEIM